TGLGDVEVATDRPLRTEAADRRAALAIRHADPTVPVRLVLLARDRDRRVVDRLVRHVSHVYANTPCRIARGDPDEKRSRLHRGPSAYVRRRDQVARSTKIGGHAIGAVHDDTLRTSTVDRVGSEIVTTHFDPSKSSPPPIATRARPESSVSLAAF